MFLYNYDSGNYINNQRNLGGEGDDGYEYGAADDDESNNVNSYYEQMEEHEQETANLFSWSLALVLIWTDLNLLLHQGKQAIWDQLASLRRGKFLFLFLCKISVLFFLAAMSHFQNDPQFMAIFELATILFADVLQWWFRVWQQ